MRAAFAIAAVSVLAIGLAGCDRKREEAASPAGDTAAPPAAPGGAAVSAGPVTAEQLPRRQSGLWEMTTSMAGEGATTTTRVCLDAETDREMAIWGGQTSKTMCPRNEIRREADGSLRFASTCNMGTGGVTRSEGTVSGDLTSSYVVKMRASTTGAELPMMNRTTDMTMTARRVGPCADGQKPGDMIGPDGRVIANMKDVTSAAP